MKTGETPAFSAVLRQHRVASGLTHEQLAERAGLSVRGISDLERGVRAQPRAYTVYQLADALNLTAEDRAIFQAAARVETVAQPDEDLSAILGVPPTGELVGREEEQERLWTALDAVHQGAGQVVLLGGELGIGKTRLLQGSLIEARGRGDVVLAARCAESSQRVALRPFVEALDRLIAAPPPGLRVEIQRSWKRIARMVAGCPVNEADDSGWGAVEQEELFRAVTDFLLLPGRSLPVVVVLDDLHWADERSLLLLIHLSRVTRVAPLLLLGAFRDVRITEEHPALARMLRRLAQERLADRLTIRRLSLEETTRLVETLIGDQPVSEEFASFVYRRTKGIPRLIDQLIRSLGGRLELEGEIGAGSMGRVFRAYDRDREEEVAAKLVLARSEIDLDTLLRFQQEGAVLARLDHPHIVAIHDTFAEEHASCIIMELLEGQSLGQILQDGPLPLARARAIALQVADALAYAHSQEIVHRDIKPDNVMVLSGDQVKVTDFGIARLLQPDTSLHTMATTGMRMGTPLYMAPEQIEGKKIDGRTDIYALGAMLYHMVTGRPPFKGNDALAVAVKHLQEEPVPPSQVNPAIPTDWDALILKAMAKDPNKRFQSAHDMRNALAALSEQAAARSTSERRSWRLGAVAGAIALFAAVFGGLWGHAAQSQHATRSTRSDHIAAYLTRARFNGYVYLERHGRVILNRGFGMADVADTLPSTVHTKWPAFGATRFFVALAIMKLQDQGQLSVQSRICLYISGCPAAWHPITIRELLLNTSGIRTFDPFNTSGIGSFDPFAPGVTLRGTLEACKSMPLALPPGIDAPRTWSDCNTFLLGAIVEKVTGKTWEAAMQNLVYQPAGMTETGLMTNALTPPRVGQLYRAGVPSPELNYNGDHLPYTTVDDLIRLNHALLAGKLISQRSLDTMFTPEMIDDWTDPRAPWRGYEVVIWPATSTTYKAVCAVCVSGGGEDDTGVGAGFFITDSLSPAAGAIQIEVNNDTGYFDPGTADNAFFSYISKEMYGR